MSAAKTSLAPPLGATLQRRGATFALYSREADKVELCLFDNNGREVRRHTVAERTGDVWHDYLPTVKAGQLYGYRVYGPYAPDQGLRFNGNKLLIDPYARALNGKMQWHDSLFGYKPGDPLGDRSFDKRDSAPYVPKSVVMPALPDINRRGRKQKPWEQSVVYELHVRGFTKLRTDLPVPMRGTLAGLGSPKMIEHLQRLGVTAVELLPVHAFASELPLTQRGLSNYWGYNSLTFFALHNDYLSSGEPDEFRKTVAALHAAGIEVILDVVYNHTAEGSEIGPTICFRGIDNRTYYKLAADKRLYRNDTGCGNTVDGSNPAVVRMIVDSLRYAVEAFGVDGFRFDLATALVRGDKNAIAPDAPLLKAIAAEPALKNTRLIAEPWDATGEGYGLGKFPAPWSEWNDQYRGTVRRYWGGEGGIVDALAEKLSGSNDVFGRDDQHIVDRHPSAGVNFITAHDGFTLGDLVSYAAKHNEANGEDNRDGDNNNHSFNCGVEGPSGDSQIAALRLRQKRNLLATLLLSRGVPMLRAGDELSQSQGGNNNAYCQDNATSWLDWGALGKPDLDLVDFVADLIQLRRGVPAVWRDAFLTGAADASGDKDIVWLTPDGNEMTAADWRFPNAQMLAFMLSDHDKRFVVVMNAHDQPIAFRLPMLLGAPWRRVLDTTSVDGFASNEETSGEPISIPGRAMLAFFATGKPVPEAYRRGAVDRLAHIAGISDGFYDIAGTWHPTTAYTKWRLLEALGLLFDLPADPATAVAAIERQAQTPALSPDEIAAKCYLPAPMVAGKRLWGFCIQLYGLRSMTNWGIGDFGDLEQLVEEAAKLGASAIQLNPLHALFLQRPEHCSPYAPSSRVFLNTLYIDVEGVEDFAESTQAITRVSTPSFQARLKELRETKLVDYAGVAAAKLQILKLLHRNFRERHLLAGTSPRAKKFADFVACGATALKDFAVFEALSAGFSTDGSSWHSWPEEYRNPRSAAIALFAETHGEDVEFALYLQWLASTQLHDAAKCAEDLGMTVGLVADLAVGADAAGADAWRDQELMAFGAELGAPPDQFNADGQCWGVPPMRPQILRARKYEPIARLLGGSMSWAGGLRVDHVMGLERQFWVPRERPGRDGGYVAFPFDDLCAVLARESQHHRCLVVGEDLGTVPEGFRERIARIGMLSTRVLYFERDNTGRFIVPDQYPFLSTAYAGTHDLPPVAGYIAGSDIEARRKIGLYRTPDDEAAAHAERKREIAQLFEALADTDHGQPIKPAEAVDAAHRFLARSGSGLLLVQIEDAVGEVDQANLPGTVDEYPNWRRKYAFTVAGLAGHEAFRHLAQLMVERSVS